jgi:sec-independent protein translocase protein TatB
MFDIGWGKLILIGIVALIVIGPKELPSALRTLGQWMAKIRRMASEFQNQFHEAMREAELADLKKEVDEMATKAKGYAQLDPVEDLRREVESAVGPPPELNAPLTSPPATESSPAPVSGDAPAADAPAIAAATASEPAVDPAPATVVEQAVANAPTPAEPVSSAPTSLAPGSDAPHSDAPHSDAPKSDAGRAA